MSDAICVSRVLRNRYILALLLLAGIVCGSFFIAQHASEQQHGRAALVSLVLNQKVLSQRVAFFANTIAASNGVNDLQNYQEELRIALEHMRHAHLIFSGKHAPSELNAQHLQELTLLHGEDELGLGVALEQFFHNAEYFLTLQHGQETDLARLNEINLQGMHTIMQSYDVLARIITYEAEKDILMLQRLQALSLLAILLLIIGVGITIFEPMRYAVLRSLRSAEQSQQEAQREAMNASKANDAKTHFLRLMSHELRTPLNAVIGMTGLIDRHHLPVRQQEYLTYIQQSGEHMLGIANELLQFNQLSAGKTTYTHSVINLYKEVEQTANIIRPQMLEKGLAFEVSIDCAKDLQVRSDSQRLRQIMLNLLGNALKFTQTGSVRVELHVEPSVRDNKIDLAIRVIDTGPGIPVKKQESIFKEFEQVHGLGARNYSGAGLGLSISRQFAQGLGGALTLEQSTPSGSIFLLKLCVEQVQVENTGEIAAKGEGISKSRMLVVDDNLPNRMIAKALLESDGHEVVLAEDGHIAVETFINDRKFDLILMDIEMPVMNGIEATQKIRTLNDSISIPPIIALTAHALPEDHAQLQNEGFDDVVNKPFSKEKVYECVHTVLETRRAA